MSRPLKPLATRRAIPGIGREGNESRISSAILRPSVWLGWWKTGRSCWRSAKRPRPRYGTRGTPRWLWNGSGVAGDLDACAERVAAGPQPCCVGLTEAAWGQIEELDSDTSILVAGESTMPVNSFGPRPPWSTGLVETWCRICSSTPGQVTLRKRVSSAAAASRTGRTARHSVPQVQPSCRVRPWTDAFSPPHLPDRPRSRPAREHRPAWRDGVVLFHERPHGTHRFGTHPASFPPPQPDRGAEAGRIDQLDPLPAMRMGDHPPQAGHPITARGRDSTSTLSPASSR